MDKLQSLLIKKYQSKTLASLYQLNFDSRSVDIEEWVKEYRAALTPLEDHPDILYVKKDDKEAQYKVESQGIKDLAKFLNYRPLLFDKKFIFLFDAQDLSVIVSNKLLKTFEELESSVCLFLLVADQATLLPTVESRAIKLQIPKTENQGGNEIRWEEFQTPMELINYLKKDISGGMDEKLFIERSIDKCLSSLPDSALGFSQCEELLRSLRLNEDASDFNNSKLSRLASFFP